MRWHQAPHAADNSHILQWRKEFATRPGKDKPRKPDARVNSVHLVETAAAAPATTAAATAAAAAAVPEAAVPPHVLPPLGAAASAACCCCY